MAHSVRKLHVGDFVWVAQETQPGDPGKAGRELEWQGQWGWARTSTPRTLPAANPRELVLDHVVERKRMDDLCSSIIDGRFREQKVLEAPTLDLGTPNRTPFSELRAYTPPTYVPWKTLRVERTRCSVLGDPGSPARYLGYLRGPNLRESGWGLCWLRGCLGQGAGEDGSPPHQLIRL